MEIELPYQWSPRPYQEKLWWSLEAGIKRAVCVWHRRSGKDLTAINWCAPQTFNRRGLYWHVFPTYAEGRRVVWQGQDKGGRPFLDAFPEELYHRKLDQEMSLFLKNGSIYQVVGCDHIDRLMGANPIGVIMSEYALQNPAAWNLIMPMLAENDGWAIFPYTPRGHNHGYRLFEMAKENEDWFAEKLTIDDTSATTLEAVERDRTAGMPEELIQQEYYCSFESALAGSYYAQVLTWLGDQKPPRIREVPHDESFEVITGFDIGRDTTAIWFAQQIAAEFRLIDYYETYGEEPAHYMKVMRGQADDETRHMARYRYGDCWMPHDAKAKRMGMPQTIEQQFRSMGLRVRVGKKFDLEDQHAGVRKMLRQTWIDKHKCERGLMALREYVKQAIPDQRGPNNEPLYRDQPVHNWASHGASALATLMMNFMPTRVGKFRQPTAAYVL